MAEDNFCDCGWIDKQGEFHFSEGISHEWCIRKIASMSEEEGERAGYIKIFYDPQNSRHNFAHSRPDGYCYYVDPTVHLTKAQKDALLIRGFEIDDEF